MGTKEKLIVALDVSPARAKQLITELREVVGMFKVGSHLFSLEGPRIVREIVDSGAKVFLDLKFHDIPHQVASAAEVVTELGVSMFTIHASGGPAMMSKTVAAVKLTAEKLKVERPAILAVSILTSIDSAVLAQLAIPGSPSEAVLRLVKLAESSGVDGVVASPEEAAAIRSSLTRKMLIVTPGIRLDTVVRDDQKRTASPSAALSAGADYLVVGRPIVEAPDPVAAAVAIIAEMEQSHQIR